MPHDGDVHDKPALGHNSGGEPVVWERWTKKQTYVRALEGTYGELVRELFTQPRVYHSKDWSWKGGPTYFHKRIIAPESLKIAQSIETHIDVFAPGGTHGQEHGHMNSAVFFILKGRGHDVHDGKRYDWEAGDACIVECACVHQHVADDPDDETIVLVMKAKPLFLFMHLMFQKVTKFPPSEPGPGQELYTPPTEI
jgi:mannose-6-phosphate isomerase-like protein (cupin superfamily)